MKTVNTKRLSPPLCKTNGLWSRNAGLGNYTPDPEQSKNIKRALLTLLPRRRAPRWLARMRLALILPRRTPRQVIIIALLRVWVCWWPLPRGREADATVLCFFVYFCFPIFLYLASCLSFLLFLLFSSSKEGKGNEVEKGESFVLLFNFSFTSRLRGSYNIAEMKAKVEAVRGKQERDKERIISQKRDERDAQYQILFIFNPGSVRSRKSETRSSGDAVKGRTRKKRGEG